MKIKKDAKKMYIVIALAVIALVIMGYALSSFLRKPQAASTTTSNPSGTSTQQQEQAADSSIKKSAASGVTQDSTGSSTDSSSSNSATSNTKASTSLQITAADVSAGVLHVRVLIQKVTSEGTCRIDISDGTKNTYSATSGVQAGPSSSTCQGFNIPASNFKSGKYGISVIFDDTVSSGSTTGSFSL